MRSQALLWRSMLVFLASILLMAIFLTTNLTAQQEEPGNGLRVTPVRQELTLANGQNESYQIEITNVSGGELTVVAIVNDFESDGVSGQPRLLTRPEESSPFSLREFVTLPEPVKLKSGESATVTVDVRVPENVPPGGYFGVVRFAPSGLAEDGQVTLSASVGSLLLISVPGDAQEGMELDFVEARSGESSGSIFESAPDSIAIGLNNTGGTILKPFGRVAVKNMFGKEVLSYEFNNTDQIRANVLPKSTRTFQNGIESVGRIGRFTIESTISYGEGGGNIITASSTFWIIPWRLILLALAVIGFIGWLMTGGIKMYNRKIIARSRKR